MVLKSKATREFGWLVVFGLLLWPLLSTIGPRAEGQVFPVVDEVSITKVEPLFDESHVYGSARKRRDCKFVHIEWSLGSERKASVAVAVKFLERNKIRGEGYFDFGPWALRLEPEEITRNSFAYVWHRCHPFWDTMTKFY